MNKKRPYEDYKNNQEILFDKESREEIYQGIKRAASAVGVTLGPKGDTVILVPPDNIMQVTKDGVTVAKQILGETPAEDIGCAFIRGVASQTDKSAGDGTTSASVTALAMVEEGRKYLAAGYGGNELRKGMTLASETACRYLDKIAMKITSKNRADQIRNIAHISANNDYDLAELIAEAFEKTDENGIVSVFPSPSSRSYVEVVQGMTFDQGYVDSYFSNNDEQTKAIFQYPLILITDEVVSNWKQIANWCQYAAQNDRPIVIVCEDMTDEALNVSLINKNQNKLKICPVRAPFHNEHKYEFLQDLATATGGVFMDSRKGSTLATSQDMNADVMKGIFGSAESITIENRKTSISGGKGDPVAINHRVDQIKEFLAQTEGKADGDYEAEVLRTRLAKIASNVAVIYIGAASPEEQKEKQDRAVDAFRATQGAIDDGYVAGGGITYLEVAKKLRQLNPDSEAIQAGVNIVANSMDAVLKTMLRNAGEPEQIVLNNVTKDKRVKNYGLNLQTGQYGNMVNMGVIDPVRVVKSVITNATSIASMAITSRCSIVTLADKNGRRLFA